MEDPLPWADVDASRRNGRLQRWHPSDQGKATYLHDAAACPRCQTPPEDLSWFYFRSPAETWPNECGCAGWLVVCDKCPIQVRLFIEVMS